MSDLSDVTTDELMDELRKRFDCCVFAGEFKKSDNQIEAGYWWGGTFGGISYALGLASRMVVRITHRINQEADAQDAEL